VPKPRLLYVAAILALASQTAEAQPPQRNEPRRDFLGDPLPKGALARFGTTRLRHTGLVGALSFTPDGRGLVSAGEDHRLCVWDAQGKELLQFYKPGLAFHFQLDPRMAGQFQMQMQMVRFRGGRHFVAENQSIVTAAASSDAKLLAVVEQGSSDEGEAVQAVVVLVDPAMRQELRRLPLSAPGVHTVAVSADGVLVAAGDQESENGVIRVWRAATGKEIRKLQSGKNALVNRLAFSPTNATLAGVQGNQVRLWDLATGKRARTYQDHEQAVTAFTFSADGKRLATAGMDLTVRLWEEGSEEELGKILLPQNPNEPNWITTLAFSPDGKRLAGGGNDKRLRLWELAPLKEIGQFPELKSPIHALTFSPDGTALAVGDAAGTISLWDPATGKERIGPANVGKVVDVALAVRTGAVLFQREDGTVWQADPATGKQKPLLTAKAPEQGSQTVTLSPDGRTAAVAVTAQEGATVKLYDLAGGKELFVLKGHEGPVAAVTFSSDGSLLATAGADKTLRLWQVATGKQAGRMDPVASLRRPQAPSNAWRGLAVLVPDEIGGSATGTCNSLAFSNDGKTLAGVAGGEVRLWETATGKLRGRLAAPAAGVNVQAFAPRGRYLATAGTDEVIRLWDTVTGKLLRGYFGHEGQVHCLAFTPDGRRLLSGGADGTVRVWDVATAEELGQFQGHRGEVFALALHRDGRRFVSGGADSLIYQWELNDVVRSTKAAPAQAGRLETMWADLANTDAATAFRAAAALAEMPTEVVPFLRQRLKGTAAVPPGRIDELIVELDSPRFPMRQKASQALEEIGSQAADKLRRALKAGASAETARRVQEVLDKLEQKGPKSSDDVRSVRAVEVLERIGTAEARQVLQALTQGAPGARLTQEAQAALKRLD
jgi:WD40 repeat protein